MNGNIFETASSEPVIKEDEVHIYYVQVDSAKKHLPILEKFLSEEEKLKAAKYVFEKDRVRQLISRSVLKDIMGRYISIKPEDVFFSYNEYGKPFLDEKINKKKITFNLSHSGNLIVYAVSNGRKIGVDVQEIGKTDSQAEIIKQYFSIAENTQFESLAPSLRGRAFYTCWTRKEAYVKAHGSGLSFPLNKFSVSFLPGEEAGILHDEENSISQWTLKEIFSSPEYVAAAAVEGSNLNFSFYTWSLRNSNE